MVTVVTRWPLALEEKGGWRNTSLLLPPGQWVDVLSGGHYEGEVAVKDLLSALPGSLAGKAQRPAGRKG